MKSDRFYLACLRDNVGTNVAFHSSRSGYCTDIGLAQVFSREEAQKSWNGGRDFDLPLCANRVDALTAWKVDCQHIPSESEIVEGCTAYVAFRKGLWDGNDVFWLRENGELTTDFSLADKFEAPSDGHGWVWIPFERADAVKRRTIHKGHINRRKMIQAAGLLTPDHIKRRQRRSDSGKSRWNCPSCGKINWQYNPYDFDGCKHIGCEKWRPNL